MQRFKTTLFSSLFLLSAFITSAQISNINNVNPNSGGLLTDMIDTTTRIGRSMLSLYNRFGQVGFSGYIQPQFQWTETKGSPNSYQGGDWGPYTNNRFRLRRARLRTDFSHYTADGKPSVYFVFQFDGTERGVNIRDFWGRYYENKWELFHFTAGVMARPFGHEILLSSVSREAPERGRMSQILMQTERDLGFMVSLNPRKAESKYKWLTIDAGIYNGQGLTGTAEYDTHKDIVAKIGMKKREIKPIHAKISGGISGYVGGIISQDSRLFTTENQNGTWKVIRDSSAQNLGKVAPRRYFGADVQIVFPNKKGQTEFRAEYIRGLQSATAATSATPGSFPLDATGLPQSLYTRSFDGAYFYFLQHLGSWQHQLVLKFDWYDPNKKVSGDKVDKANGFGPADVRYNTFGGGYVHYINQYLKVLAWYEHPINEKTALAGYEKDVKDGVLTLRAQFTF